MTETTKPTSKELKAKVDQLVKDKGISIKNACKEIGINPARYHYQSNKEKTWKKLVKKERKRLVDKHKKFTPTQVLVAKDEKVNIVIMKGNREAVEAIAKSLSWMGSDDV